MTSQTKSALISRPIAGFLLMLLLSFSIQCNSEKSRESIEPVKDFPVHKIDSIANHILEGNEVLGFSIAIVKPNDTIYHSSFGHTDTTRTSPIRSDHLFLLASISKVLGGVLAMKLIEEGKLSLDQSLFDLLPSFPNQNQAKQIKLHHILSHTSGLPEYSRVIDSNYVKTRVAPTDQELMNFFEGRPLVFSPGTDYQYCNSGFLFLGWIIESITGEPLQNSFDRIINTTTGLDFQLIGKQSENPHMLPYYELHSGQFVPEPHWTWIKGDGGLTSTVLDLAHFPFHWVNGKIISNESFSRQVLHTTLTNQISIAYGLGVRHGLLEGERFIGHSGGHFSTKSILAYFPERELSIAVMVNTDRTSSHARRIFSEIALAVFDKPHPDYSETQVNLADLAIYEGFYKRPGDEPSQFVEIRLGADRRLLHYHEAAESEGIPMQVVSEDEFWIEQWPFDRVYFNRSPQGDVVALTENYYGFIHTLRTKL